MKTFLLDKRVILSNNVFGDVIDKMKEKDIVKFREPISGDEKTALMVVIEMRGERVLVSDLRFTNWGVPPTTAYLVKDLEVIEISEEENQTIAQSVNESHAQ